jgi:hypothetical protein
VVALDENTVVTYIISIEQRTETVELGGKGGLTLSHDFWGYYGSQIITVDMSAVEHNEREAVKQVSQQNRKKFRFL